MRARSSTGVVPAALSALCAACEPVVSPSAAPGCTAIVTEVSLTSEDRLPEASVILVIDGSITERLGAVRGDALRRSLTDTVTMLLDGDRDRDGRGDFRPPTVLRLAVVGVDGTVLALPTPAPPGSRDPRGREIPGGLEVWPGELAWDAWFLDAAIARLDAALDAPRPIRVTPITALRGFAALHPDFVPRWVDPALVVVTDRDLDDDSGSELPFEYRRGSLSITAAIPVSLLPAPGAPPAFAALLGEHPFDDSTPPCEDGAVVGVYPRRLLTVAAEADAAGAWVELVSLCDPGGAGVKITGWGVEQAHGPCLPRPLPVGEDRLVNCEMTMLLPSAGVLTRCEQFDLDLVERVRSEGGTTRERCALRQLLREELRESGFYYDDFGVDVFDACTSRVRLTLSEAGRLQFPYGARIEARCETGTTPCGFARPSSGDAGTLDGSG